MRCLVSLLFASWLMVASSQACTGNIPSDLSPGREMTRHFKLQDTDPRLGAYDREYIVVLPEGYTGFEQVPLLFYFHGWSENCTCSESKLCEYGSKNGVVVVKPKGMGDGSPSSWNLGTANHTDTCVKKDVGKYNYSSCSATGVTSMCNCGTCYDDFNFVSDLYNSLLSELCVDPGNIFASGASFGSLFNYYAAPVFARQEKGPHFRAILPWYGAFYQHTQDIVPMSSADRSPSIFHFHGLKDTEVPPGGGESSDGYVYIPIETTLQAYAVTYNCSAQPTSLKTPFDGQGTLVGCKEWHGCRDDLRVVRCDWKEEHGFWPDYAEAMMGWFMASRVNSDAVLV